MKAEELAVIKERAENATNGPWEWRTDFLDCEELYSWNDDDVLTAGCGQNVGFVKVSEANAEFIAHARQDVPKLVAEVERLQAQEHFAEYAIRQNKALWEALSKACESLGADTLDYYEEEGGV